MNKLTIRDVDIRNKRVLIRVDFNVPLDEKGQVVDDTRIRSSLPTIQYCLQKKAKVILMSHLGRPDGKAVEKLRMDSVAHKLGELLGQLVTKLSECIGSTVRETVEKMKPGQVVLLENLRFHPEEEKNNPDFAREIANLGEVYVNDAFGSAHRAHASTEGVAHYLPSVAGFLMEREIEYLGGVLTSPKRPFVAILGGVKVSDKIGVIQNLIKNVDRILIGGGMAYTFLLSQGVKIGKSKLESDKIPLANHLMTQAKAKGISILLPVDHRIAREVKAGTKIETTQGAEIPNEWLGVDIGPKTVESFRKVLSDAKTVVWNGPLGIFELEGMDWGTRQIAEFLARLDAVKVIGGGDTAAAIASFGLESAMTHISTGGGASLEFMEGKILPGIAVLLDKNSERVSGFAS